MSTPLRVIDGDGESPGADAVVIQRTADGIEVNTSCGPAETTDLIARAFVAWCLPTNLEDER